MLARLEHAVGWALASLSLTGTVLASILIPSDRRPFDAFGCSFDFCGDLDGDKVQDIAIGSPHDGIAGEGCVYLYSGRTAALLHVWKGDRPGCAFGMEVARAGDVDRDGVEDLAIGSPWCSDNSVPGRVEIRSGRDRKLLKSFCADDGEVSFGRHMVSLGDLDGDGVSDLLVDCQVGSAAENGEQRQRFAVISLATGKRLIVITSPAGNSSSWDERPMCAMGDVNHDGIPDFAIEYGARVSVCSGKDGAVLHALVHGEESGTWSPFGHALSGIGDVNGDGCRDLIVGSSTYSSASFCSDKPGSIQIYSGKDGALLRNIDRANDAYGAGFAVSPLGDVNRDGAADFVASTSDSFSGIVSIYSGKDGTVLRSAEFDRSASPTLGWRVVGGADLDGDGVPDFMAAAFWAHAYQGEEGQGVHVFSGATGKKIRDFSLRQRGGTVPTPPGVSVLTGK